MRVKSIKINAILNGIKQCCTVLFPLITTPYVTKILGVENYGKVSFGNSVVSYFVLLAALGVSAYAIREGAKLRNQKAAFQHFCNEVFSINVLTTLVSYGLLLLLLLFWKQVQNYWLLILIQSSVIIFTTVGADWVSNIFEDFQYTTIRYIAFQFLGLVAMFLFVRNVDDYLIYAGITAAVSICSSLTSVVYLRKRYVRIQFTWDMKLREHIRPMLLLFSNNLASTVYVNSNVTLLTLIKGDAVTGVFSIAVKVYTIIKQFIYALVGVTLPRLAAYLGEKDLQSYNKLLNKVFHALVILVLPCMVGVVMLSGQIIDILAGADYLSGTLSLQILAIALMFTVLSNFFAYGIMVPNGLEKQCLIATSVSAVVNVGMNLVMIPLFSLNGAAITTVVSEAIVLAMSGFYAKDKWEYSVPFKRFVAGILGCIGICIVCAIIRQMVANSILVVMFAVTGSVLVYVVVLFAMGEELITQIVKKYFFRKGS